MNPDYAPFTPAPPAAASSKLPAKHTLEYCKLAIELLLLLLAIPWLLRELVRHPGRVSKAAASKHLKG